MELTGPGCNSEAEMLHLGDNPVSKEAQVLIDVEESSREQTSRPAPGNLYAVIAFDFNFQIGAISAH
jgi:hypothetical protein